jgi:hypothetical protein
MVCLSFNPNLISNRGGYDQETGEYSDRRR